MVAVAMTYGSWGWRSCGLRWSGWRVELACGWTRRKCGFMVSTLGCWAKRNAGRTLRRTPKGMGCSPRELEALGRDEWTYALPQGTPLSCLLKQSLQLKQYCYGLLLWSKLFCKVFSSCKQALCGFLPA